MAKWHPRRRNRLKVRYGAGKSVNAAWDAKNHLGGYLLHHATIIVHPKLRLADQHDELWDTIGHEFSHHVFGASEKLAYRVERRMGQALHDLMTGFKPPKCACSQPTPKSGRQ